MSAIDIETTESSDQNHFTAYKMSESRDKIHAFGDADPAQLASFPGGIPDLLHQASAEASKAVSIPESKTIFSPYVDKAVISSRHSVRLTNRSAASSQSRKSLRNGGPRPWPDPNKYNERSFFLFTLENSFRRTLIFCIEWPWWDRTVLFVIFINTVVLAINDPYDIPQLLPISEKRVALEFLSKVSVYNFTPPMVFGDAAAALIED
jgi:hypothetical protein